MAPPSLSTIPLSVNSHHPLLLNASATKNSNGVFASAPIKSGDVVYDVKRPLVCVIGGGRRSLLRTHYDNCFKTNMALSDEKMAKSTSSSPLKNYADFAAKPPLKVCTGCKICYYCNDACRESSWQHHHEAECPTLATLEATPDMEDFILSSNCRSVIRLTQMRLHGKITDEQWAELKTMPTERSSRMNDPDFVREAEENAETLVKLGGSKKEWLDLICLVYQNKRFIMSPGSSPPPGIFEVGYFLEPLTSMVAHSCDPNSFIVFEGNELRIRTLRDISANEELTLDWAFGNGHVKARRLPNEAFYNIKCKCRICEQGGMGLSGPLFKKSEELIASFDAKRTGVEVEIERHITNIRESGYGWGVSPLWYLHSLLFRRYLEIKKFDTCICYCLKIRYLIEPADPPRQLADRLTTLNFLLNVLKISIYKRNLIKLPDSVHDASLEVYFHLEQIIVRDIGKCFGEDSQVAIERRNHSETNYGRFQERAPPGWKRIPLKQSADERTKFVKNMNTLLKWAGIREHTEELI